VLKSAFAAARLLGALSWSVALSAGLGACSTPDVTDLSVPGGPAATVESGSVRLALAAGDRTITTVTAVLEGKDGFASQTHQIDVQGDNGVISIFFGDLPAARGYRITLSADDCRGSATFNVDADQVSLVDVPLSCGEQSAGQPSGSAQITGSIQPGGGSGSPGCDFGLQIVAAPSVQNGSGPISGVSLSLRGGVTPTGVQWSSSSSNGASGTIGDLSGAADTSVSFDCSSNGIVYVVAKVTGSSNALECIEQTRVRIDCVNQSGSAPLPVCGNGLIETGEVCDTNGAGPDVLPAGSPASSSCSSNCTQITTGPSGPGPICGNGVIETGEACDTNGAGVDVLPPATPPGSTCAELCTAIVPPAPPPPPPPGGACLACAQANCATQYADALGSTSSAANVATVTQLFDCVIGSNWESGGPIPASSCFFKDPGQPRGSLLPCYCGATPQATCLGTGPADHNQACGVQVEAASGCTTLTASCVTGSGSNPAVPLGDALQLLNCERAACEAECGFPVIFEE